MKTDANLKRFVQDELAWDPQVKSTAVGVVVKDGVVTLTGHLDTFAEKLAPDHQRRGSEKAVRPLIGAVGVSNGIKIKSKLAPIDLERRIAQAFARQVDREMKHLQVLVDGSTVTLRVTVNSRHERDAAQGVARQTPGVHAVINELEVG